jgi:SNF2 family DNA or RNA helicase
MKFQPHPYQREVGDFLVDRLWTHAPAHGPAGAGVLLDPGLGKTAITLAAIETLAALDGECRTLIVAPKRVCQLVWPAEVLKWGFAFGVEHLTGTPSARAGALLKSDADLFLITPDLLPWLVGALDLPGAPQFDLVVFDESTKFKTWGAKRTKAARRMLPRFPRRMILTGTPSPNGLGDLHSQVYLIDDGATLGKTKGYFQQRFMNRGGFQGREWSFDDRKIETLHEAIAPLVIRMAAEDHLDMPAKVDNVIPVELPPSVAKEYRRLERELFMALANGEELVASSAGAKYAICRGVANGGVYVGEGENRAAQYVHGAKVDAVKDLVDELGGKPVMVAYQFLHDRDRLLEAFPHAPVIGGGMKHDDAKRVTDAWNRGEVRVLLVQPQAMSHGLNLQAGGNDICWFGLTDQLEVYQQLNARLWRQGVRGQVRIHHVLAQKTVDEAIYARIHEKADTQTTLMDSLAAYRKRMGL